MKLVKRNHNRTNVTIWVSIFVLLLSTLTFAQKNDYSKYKGYVDFGNLSKFETSEEVTEVLIEEHLIRMVSKMAGKNEPELGSVLDGIKLIKVHTFGVSDGNYDQLAKIVSDIDKRLVKDGWDRIVKTKSRDEVVNVYIKTAGEDEFVGLTVVTVDKGGEAAFVNIVGNINMDALGKLGQKFDIPGLDDIHK